MTENVPSAAFSILASLLAHASMHVGFSLTLRVDCFSQYSMQIRDCNIVQHFRLCTRTEALPIRKVKCAEAPTLCHLPLSTKAC